MLQAFLHNGYKKSILARLRGSAQVGAVPDGGITAKRLNQALFMLCGRLARLDGQVTPAAIRNSTRLMGALGLDPAGRALAVEYFNQGKSQSSDVIPVLERLVSVIGVRSELACQLLITLSEAAGLDGGIGLQQRILLRRVAEILGYEKAEYERICLRSIPYGEYGVYRISSRVSEAYRQLELPPGVSQGEVRRAYLRLVSRYHPDKLASGNASLEAVRQARERFAAICEAYEVLCGPRKVGT